jgi:hypothetical protein
MLVAYNKQQWKDEIPDLTKPIRDSSGKQKTDPQTGRPLYELVQEGTRLTSQRLNHIEDGIETVHELSDQNTEDIDAHKKDTIKHITAAERAEWKAKETPASAQSKADAALSAAKTYADTALLAKADKSSTYSKTETDQRIQAVVGAAPDALDTLKEIGDALNNDPNFAATVTNQLSGKVDKVSGKQLSTEDYSSAEKAKLAGLTPGAGAAGSATDATIGNRTADPSITTPYSLTGTITQWFSWLTKYLKAITGKANPFDTPDITLAATKTHVDNTTVHVTAAERSAWNAAETNAKNASIPKSERDSASGVPALDASKHIITEGLVMFNRYRQTLLFFEFANGVQFQRVDVFFPSVSGYVELSVVGSFNNFNVAGKLVKRFNGTYSQTSTIYNNGSYYTEVSGSVKNHLSIGEPVWDATKSMWKVTLEARDVTPIGNPYSVLITTAAGAVYATGSIPTIGAVYVGTAVTTLPKAVQVIPADTVLDSGQEFQKYRLTQNDGTAILYSTGSMDTLLTPGVYYVASAVTEKPAGFPNGGLCEVIKIVGGSSGSYQRITDFLNLRVFVRYRHNDVWLTWVEIENANRKNVANGYAGLDSASKVGRGNVYSSLGGAGAALSNLDTALTAGVYPTTNNPTGAPEAAYGIVRISVNDTDSGNGGNWVFQEWTGQTGNIYTRLKINALAFTTWAKKWDSLNDQLLVRQRTTVGAGTDLNTVTTAGVYHLSAASGYTNGPGIDWCVLNVYVTNTNYVVQEVYSVNLMNRVFRTRTELNIWSAWTPVITGAGGTMTAPLTRNYAPAIYKYHNVTGYYNGENSTVQGTIKITLPVAWTSAMLNIKIRGFNYTGSTGVWELTLGGYNFSGAMWTNVTAEIRGKAPFSDVRFAYDGAKCCILLGVTSTAWAYPSIDISEVVASHSGAAGLGSGWAISLITSETGITSVFKPVLMYGNADTLGGWLPSQTATPNTVAVRNSKGELEGVSSTLAKVDDTPITNSSAGIMALNYNVTGTDQTLNVSAYLSLMGASNFSMYISYTDPRLGLKNYEICPLKRLEGEAYVFVPAFIRAKAGTEVRLMVVHSDDAFPAYITASIGKG